MAFVLPQGQGSRPAWLVRAGLFLYDRLGGARSLPGARSVAFRGDPLGAPLRETVGRGFVYTDCATDDARLTIATARDAAMRGAEILPRTEFLAAHRENTFWRASLRAANGETRKVAARILVNAVGPWVMDVLARAGLPSRATLRLVKGSHIVVPRLYEGDHAYLLQNDDRRIVFVIPFEREFSLIGTTELPFAGDPASAEISEDEIAYLCRAVGRWFSVPPTPADVVWSYAGVRPLHEDRAKSAAAVSRNYVFELDTERAPALSIFGGKLTTYRRLAEHALARLAPYLPETGPPWTANSVLPGGEGLPDGGTVMLAAELAREYPFLAQATADRLARSYGSDPPNMLRNGPGRDFGQGLNEAELRWLVDNEWARNAEDVLWRRTKLGLHVTPAEAQAIADYLADLTRSEPSPVDAASLPTGRTAYR
jgi:glycerol-3-phosphate dehydrogenase